MMLHASSRLPWLCASIALLLVACPKPKPPAATSCTTSADCPTGQDCTNGTCGVPCAGKCTKDQICLDDACVNADGVNCASSASICPTGFTCGPAQSCERQCMMNSDCPLPADPICDINTFVCAQCSVNGDCTGAGKPVCSSTGTCIQCATDSDCESGGVATGKYCNTMSSTCVPGCLTLNDCVPGTLSCTSNGTTPGMCVQCQSDTDCAPNSASPVCNPATSQYVACLSNTDCSATTGQCNTTTNECVVCVENSVCARGQICDPATDTCINGCTGGTGGSNCPPATPVCDTTMGANGTCVTCLVDTDCPVAEVCSQSQSGNECVPGCKTDDRCAGNGDATFCNPTANGGLGQCVQCVRNSQCPAHTVCDVQGQFCRCSGAGEGCSSNADCGYERIAAPDGGTTFDCFAIGAECINVVRCGASTDPTYHIMNQICSQTAQGLPDQCPANTSTSYTHCPGPPQTTMTFVTEFAGYDGSANPNTTDEGAVNYSHMCVPEANACTVCE